MSNIRLQAILKNEVTKMGRDFQCKDSIAFIRFMLYKQFTLDEFEIDEAITDKGMDKGIDAIFEQVNENGENILYVIQAKYFQNPDKTIAENDKNLVVEAVSNYILGNYPLQNVNEKLRLKIESYQKRFFNGDIDKIEIVFLTNGQQSNTNIISELEQFKKENEGQISYQIITENDLSRIFAPSSSTVVDSIAMRIVKDNGTGDRTILNFPDIDTAQGKIFKVDITVLAEIVKNNPNIFSANVRAFQSLRNKVNDQIATTLRNPQSVQEFIYLNNGITFICDDWCIKPGGEVTVLDKPSIINGCQTASTILEVYNENLIAPNTGFVLVRVIKTKDIDVKEKIIKASNTQTAINARDLISDDLIQKELESQFTQLGYFYIRKRGMYADKPKAKTIDLEKAAQYYLSLYLRKPAEAKNKKSEIYRSYYEQIFNRTLTAKQLLVGWLLFNKISEKIKEYRKNISSERRSILGNSIMHLLPLFDEWVIKPSGKMLSDLEDDVINKNTLLKELVDTNINTVVKKLEHAIKAIKLSDKNFNPQYFFKSSDSLDEILGTKAGESNYCIELDHSKISRVKDLRYYKPDSYSLGDDRFNKIVHWNDLFVKLINLYSKQALLKNGNIDFINSSSRKLLISNPNSEDQKIRKQIENGLWLLTNFDAKRLSTFCFSLAQQLGLNLKIRLRPTRFRIQKKYKKKSRSK